MDFNPHNPTIKRLAAVAVLPVVFGQDLSEEECVIQALVALNSPDGLQIGELFRKIQQHRNFSMTEIETAVEDLVNADVLRRLRNARGYQFGFTLEFMKVIRDYVKENAHRKLEGQDVVKANYEIGEKGLNLTAPEFRKLYAHAKNYMALVADGCIGDNEDKQGIFFKNVWFDFLELCVFVKNVEDNELIFDK